MAKQDYAGRCISSLEAIKQEVPAQHPIRECISQAISIFRNYKDNLPPVPDTGTQPPPPRKK